ncbi:uncharacterized protein FFB20_05545 [Fusarium fujikuroi]|nr:uncharacterized protein FFB20_05545 [Fusarium fujikuroi]
MINDTQTDIENPGFFSIDYLFYGSKIDEVACCPGSPLPLTAKALDKSDTYPNIWTKADSLAKAAYSTILVDLGQKAAPKPNILSDTKLLTRYTENFSTARMANLRSGPANDSYSTLKETTGSLGITPSVFAATYISDLVLLQADGSFTRFQLNFILVDDAVPPSVPSQESGLEYYPLVNTPQQSNGLFTGGGV